MSDRHVTGVVLAGGRSRRMGVDKASLVIGDRTLLRCVVDRLAEAGCEPVLVLHRRPEELTDVAVPIVHDRHGGQGPLDGVITALSIAATSVVVTVPVDLPRFDHADIGRLITELENRSDLDVVVAVDSLGGVQHLAAAWRKDRCLPILQQAFANGERAVRRAIDGLATGRSVVASGHLLNLNTPADLEVDL